MSAPFKAIAVGLTIAALSFTAASAQESAESIPVAWGISEAPAAAALDIGRSESNPPSVMRRFSGELLNGDGATGFAAETSPYMVIRDLFGGDRNRFITSAEYQRNPTTRILAGLNLSAAIVDKDESSRGAAALSWTLFNRGDPYYSRNRTGRPYDLEDNFYLADARDHTGCINSAIDSVPPPSDPGAEGDSVTVQNNAALANALQSCIDEFKKRTWNATSLRLVATQTWESEDGLESLGPTGVRYGAVFSYGFEGLDRLSDNSQLLVSAFTVNDERIIAEDDSIQRRDQTTVGIRLRVAPNFDGGENDNADNFHISGEAAWSRNEYRGALPTQEQWTYRLGAERRLSDNLWFSLTIEDRSGDEVQGDDTRATFGLQWALHDEAQFSRD